MRNFSTGLIKRIRALPYYEHAEYEGSNSTFKIPLGHAVGLYIGVEPSQSYDDARTVISLSPCEIRNAEYYTGNRDMFTPEQLEEMRVHASAFIATLRDILGPADIRISDWGVWNYNGG
jgi:hypothetical protein